MWMCPRKKEIEIVRGCQDRPGDVNESVQEQGSGRRRERMIQVLIWSAWLCLGIQVVNPFLKASVL